MVSAIQFFWVASLEFSSNHDGVIEIVRPPMLIKFIHGVKSPPPPPPPPKKKKKKKTTKNTPCSQMTCFLR